MIVPSNKCYKQVFQVEHNDEESNDDDDDDDDDDGLESQLAGSRPVGYLQV